jgi:hypothetical protein
MKRIIGDGMSQTSISFIDNVAQVFNTQTQTQTHNHIHSSLLVSASDYTKWELFSNCYVHLH